VSETEEPKIAFEKDEYRLRLKVLRKLFNDMNATEFSEFIGVPYKKWHHYERGYPIARETAFLMIQKRIPVEWLWFGDYEGQAERDWILAQLRELLRKEKQALKKGQKKHPAHRRIKEPKVSAVLDFRKKASR
jgi:hypothetical protein